MDWLKAELREGFQLLREAMLSYGPRLEPPPGEPRRGGGGLPYESQTIEAWIGAIAVSGLEFANDDATENRMAEAFAACIRDLTEWPKVSQYLECYARLPGAYGAPEPLPRLRGPHWTEERTAAFAAATALPPVEDEAARRVGAERGRARFAETIRMIARQEEQRRRGSRAAAGAALLAGREIVRRSGKGGDR